MPDSWLSPSISSLELVLDDVPLSVMYDPPPAPSYAMSDSIPIPFVAESVVLDTELPLHAVSVNARTSASVATTICRVLIAIPPNCLNLLPL